MTLDSLTRLVAWRIALAGWLTGWFANSLEIVRLFAAGTEYPIEAHPLFPALWRAGWVAQLAWILPLAGCVGFAVSAPRRLGALAWGLSLCALGLLGHLFSYNDAGYTTAFWSGLWLVWWAGRLQGSDPGSVRHAIALGQGIIGLCFLGGVIGKLTPEYWSGEVIHELYIGQKPYLPFRAMRDHWSDEASRSWSAAVSRIIIVGEGLLATLILWPPRVAAVLTCGAFLGMVFMARWQILSVLAPLAGLMAACVFLDRGAASGSAQGQDANGRAGQ